MLSFNNAYNNHLKHWQLPADGAGEGGAVGWGRGVKALLQLANFILGPDATLNTEKHKNSVRIYCPFW